MFEELENFLGGTFHQDIDSPESAIKEYVAGLGQHHIVFIIKCMKEFLNSDLSEKEKNNFIERNTEIYFPEMKMTAIEWLQGVMEYFIMHVNI